jgi:hypothetical protein
MQADPEQEYAQLKEFLSVYIERYLKAVEDMPPEKRPMAVAEVISRTLCSFWLAGRIQRRPQGIPGAAAATSVRALPRRFGMVLADPAAVLTQVHVIRRTAPRRPG